MKKKLTRDFGLEEAEGSAEAAAVVADLVGLGVDVKPPLEPASVRSHLPKVRAAPQLPHDLLDRGFVCNTQPSDCNNYVNTKLK